MCTALVFRTPNSRVRHTLVGRMHVCGVEMREGLTENSNIIIIIIHAGVTVWSARVQVYAVRLVKAACFYGYNPQPEPFLRISL